MNHVKKQIERAELQKGVSLNNEYEMISFNHFTLNRVYPTDLGLGKRVVEKPIGYKRKDLHQALQTAVDTLNRNLTKNKYTLDDFVEGIYRIEPTTGTEYELYFKHKLNKSGFTKITVLRPFAPLVQIANILVNPKKELIHIILPLSGRVHTFQGFMDKFVKIGLKNDRRVLLTVVYFGEEGLSEARMIMSKAAGKNSAYLRLLALNETFSRSKGLKVIYHYSNFLLVDLTFSSFSLLLSSIVLSSFLKSRVRPLFRKKVLLWRSIFIKYPQQI